MKTFKQFLLSEATDHNELKELLEHFCAPFIRESKSRGLLKRGMKFSRENEKSVADPFDDNDRIYYWERAVRQDRKPKDLTAGLHLKIDQWFNEKFGFKARSQTVFCVGERGNVAEYGDLYYIFPMGEFQYVWSPNVRDLFNAKSREMVEYPEDVTDVEKEKYTPLEFFMEGLDYTNEDLDKAVVARHEVMLKCDKYLAFPKEAGAALRKALDIDLGI